MVTVLLDGYNVIHAVPELAQQLDRSLDAAREALISLCRRYRTLRGDVSRLYVVFDGNDASAGGPQDDRGGVTVLFTRREEEADERILSLLRAEGGRGRFVVVSNDTYILNNARGLRARVISVREFYERIQPSRPRRAQPSADIGKIPLSTRDAQHITDAYRAHLDARAARPPRNAKGLPP